MRSAPGWKVGEQGPAIYAVLSSQLVVVPTTALHQSRLHHTTFR